MHAHTACRKWSIWSYQLALRKPLAVLGGSGLIRKGWILGKFDILTSKWLYGEISPIYTFHKTNPKHVYNDIINTVRDNNKPQTALVKTVFDIWNVPHLDGQLHINSLLDSTSVTVPSGQRTIKIKLGRQSLDKDIEWFRHLQSKYPHVLWRLDCNRQWTGNQLRSFWASCDPTTIEYIEDPLLDPTRIETVPEIPIALDESLIEYHYLLDTPNVVAAIIKPTLHLNWQQLLIKYPTVTGVISSTFEGSLGIWGLGQLALAHIKEGTHGLGTLDWFAEEVVDSSLSRTPDCLYISRTPPTPRFSRLRWEDGE